MRKASIKIDFRGLSVLSAYVVFMAWRLFFYAYSNNYREQMESISYNLIPFKTILNYMRHSNHISFDIWIYNLAGNVAAFMPLGFLLPLAFRGFKATKTFISSFALILLAEVLQLISRRGVFDVDDILLNMLGCVIGYVVYKFLLIFIRSWR